MANWENAFTAILVLVVLRNKPRKDRHEFLAIFFPFFLTWLIIIIGSCRPPRENPRIPGIGTAWGKYREPELLDTGFSSVFPASHSMRMSHGWLLNKLQAVVNPWLPYSLLLFHTSLKGKKTPLHIFENVSSAFSSGRYFKVLFKKALHNEMANGI